MVTPATPVPARHNAKLGVTHLEKIHVTWAHLKKKRTRLQLYTKFLEEIVQKESGDGVTSIKQRRQDIQGDGVMDLATASGRSRLNVALEYLTW
ncbi:hypothetical protein Tco_0671039 [Tanacetum coccineum]